MLADTSWRIVGAWLLQRGVAPSQGRGASPWGCPSRGTHATHATDVLSLTPPWDPALTGTAAAAAKMSQELQAEAPRL